MAVVTVTITSTTISPRDQESFELILCANATRPFSSIAVGKGSG